MSNFTVTEHNTVTNKIIVRDMNDEEIAYIKNQQEIFEQNLAQAAANQQAKAALLERLGISEDEAKLLIG